METIRAQPIYKTKELHYHWRRFKIWEQDSMLLYPVLFMLGAIALVWITTGLDAYLIEHGDLPLWATTKPGVGVSITSLVSSSVLSLLAIGFSVSMVTLQLANQQYTPRVIHLFTRSSVTKLALSLFIATFVYSFILQAEVLGTRVEEIAIVSVSTNILLMFSCLIVFIFVMKSVLFMSWVTDIMRIIADETRESIDANLPPDTTYVECESVSLEQPSQVIDYARPPSTPFVKRYDQGVLKSLEHSTLVYIASKHKCVLRVLPRYGDYINEGDPIVEVYGATGLQPEQVVKAVYAEIEAGMGQYPLFGIRMLADMAVQALPPSGNASTTVHQVILRLTNLLLDLAQYPEHSGVFCDQERQIRLLHPKTTWEEYIETSFGEICHYGKQEPVTRASLEAAFDLLLERLPEPRKPPVQQQKDLLFS